jgi:hypothetical protein
VLVTLICEAIILFVLIFIKEDKMSEWSCRFVFFFVYLYLFLFSLLRIEFGVIPSSKLDQYLKKWIDESGGYYFYLKIFFPFYFI